MIQQTGQPAGATERAEPCGVWGGEIFHQGAITADKKPRAAAQGPGGERSVPRLSGHGHDLHGDWTLAAARRQARPVGRAHNRPAGGCLARRSAGIVKRHELSSLVLASL